MNEVTKESKFLDAINKYAEKQKKLISEQVEEYKAEKIEQATESGLQDAYDLIQRDIARRKAAIVTEYARREYALRRELYAQRQRCTDEVFASATEKLIAYTATDAYKTAFARSAEKAASLCGGCACVLYVNERDRSIAEASLPLFKQAVIQTDASIRIGGVKVLCEDKGVVLDDTLDSRLVQERAKFTEYSGLKVV